MTAKTRKTAAPAAETPAAPVAEAAPAVVPAAPAPLALSFEDAEVPTVARVVERNNPFDAVVKALSETHEVIDGKERSKGAKRVTVPTDRVSAIVRQISDAAHLAGVTSRKTTTEDKDSGTTVITFWTVPRISHKDRKNGNGAESAPATENAPAAENAAE